MDGLWVMGGEGRGSGVRIHCPAILLMTIYGSRSIEIFLKILATLANFPGRGVIVQKYFAVPAVALLFLPVADPGGGQVRAARLTTMADSQVDGPQLEGGSWEGCWARATVFRTTVNATETLERLHRAHCGALTEQAFSMHPAFSDALAEAE